MALLRHCYGFPITGFATSSIFGIIGIIFFVFLAAITDVLTWLVSGFAASVAHFATAITVEAGHSRLC